jgi:hypothetical protein
MKLLLLCGNARCLVSCSDWVAMLDEDGRLSRGVRRMSQLSVYQTSPKYCFAYGWYVLLGAFQLSGRFS